MTSCCILFILGSAWPFGPLDPSVRQARYTDSLTDGNVSSNLPFRCFDKAYEQNNLCATISTKVFNVVFQEIEWKGGRSTILKRSMLPLISCVILRFCQRHSSSPSCPCSFKCPVLSQSFFMITLPESLTTI